jgi:adenosylhomocysteine nucleosidase
MQVSRGLVWQPIKESGTNRVPRVASGVIVTGDVFVASAVATERFHKQQQAMATEMEGAAIGQVCWQQHVPFLIIRSLSDNANSHAAMDVRAFYQVAANNSASLVIALAGALR